MVPFTMLMGWGGSAIRATDGPGGPLSSSTSSPPTHPVAVKLAALLLSSPSTCACISHHTGVVVMIISPDVCPLWGFPGFKGRDLTSTPAARGSAPCSRSPSGWVSAMPGSKPHLLISRAQAFNEKACRVTEIITVFWGHNNGREMVHRPMIITIVIVY